MSHRYQPGDRVVVVNSEDEHFRAVCTVTEISLGEGEDYSACDGDYAPVGKLIVTVDIPTSCHGGGCECSTWYYPEELRPYDDGAERGEWTELTRNLCKPKTVSA
jgi:hypothetical protein